MRASAARPRRRTWSEPDRESSPPRTRPRVPGGEASSEPDRLPQRLSVRSHHTRVKCLARRRRPGYTPSHEGQVKDPSRARSLHHPLRVIEAPRELAKTREPPMRVLEHAIEAPSCLLAGRWQVAGLSVGFARILDSLAGRSIRVLLDNRGPLGYHALTVLAPTLLACIQIRGAEVQPSASRTKSVTSDRPP